MNIPNETERNGVYYKVEGDPRWHTDNKLIEEVRKVVPPYFEDTCPACGNKEGISGCRCFVSHRSCPFCNTKWHWELDRRNAKMRVIIE